MDTITLKVKTTKPTQEIEFRFSETRNSKPIQFKIDWGDGTLNTQTSHVYKMPAIKKPYIIKISLIKSVISNAGIIKIHTMMIINMGLFPLMLQVVNR